MKDFEVLFSPLIRKLREFHLVEYDSKTQTEREHKVQITQRAARVIEDLLGDIEESNAKIETLKEENAELKFKMLKLIEIARQGNYKLVDYVYVGDTLTECEELAKRGIKKNEYTN